MKKSITLIATVLIAAISFTAVPLSMAAPAQYPPNPDSTSTPAPQAPVLAAITKDINQGYTLFSFNKLFRLVPNSVNSAGTALSATNNGITATFKASTVKNSILQNGFTTKITATGKGFKPNSSISLIILKPLTYVTSGKVSATGRFTVSSKISSKLKAGKYRIQVVGRTAKGVKTSVTNTIRLVG